MSNTNSPGLIRIPVAAERIGISAYQFSEALLSREIPISLVRLGRFYFVRASELEQWLAPVPAHDPDPFA